MCSDIDNIIMAHNGNTQHGHILSRWKLFPAHQLFTTHWEDTCVNSLIMLIPCVHSLRYIFLEFHTNKNEQCKKRVNLEQHSVTKSSHWNHTSILQHVLIHSLTQSCACLKTVLFCRAWRWLENAVTKIWTISCDNSETVRDRMSVTINH